MITVLRCLLHFFIAYFVGSSNRGDGDKSETSPEAREEREHEQIDTDYHERGAYVPSQGDGNNI